MWGKLKEVEERFEELGMKLSQAEVVSDRELYQKLSKEHKSLIEIVATYQAYKKAKDELVGSKDILFNTKDPELLEMAKEETKYLEKELEELELKLQFLLLPKDANDERNALVEIRAGAGGDEAGIFAGDLFRMYTRYAEKRGWKVELISASEASAGGYKEVIAMVTGEGVFARMKYERGVHRVQRVPATETQGRIHTSTITVAVMPEAEEIDLIIDPKDIRTDIYRASGAGGQHVNKTDSAVRLTHIPTGTVVAMQDERSQHKNRDKAMKVLRMRILEQMQEKADSERTDERRSQIGTGDRSEKIRTYNFPQSRITDHRIGLSVYSIDPVLDGDLDQFMDPLISHFQMEALKQSVN